MIDVREFEGVLDYIYLSDVLPNKTFHHSKGKRKSDVPIRKVHLISKYTYNTEGQLDLPFVKEEIEKAILERNIQLEKTKIEIIQKNTKKPKKRKEKALSSEEIEFATLVQKMGGMENFLKLMNENEKKEK